MNAKRQPVARQAEIAAKDMPLVVTTAAVVNPRTGKPTSQAAAILAALDKLIDFQKSQGKSTVTVTVTAAQAAVLRDNHREYPSLAGLDEVGRKAAVAEHAARPLIYKGVELVAPV